MYKKYIRVCPQCGKTIEYSCQKALNLALKKNSYCNKCRLDNAYNLKAAKNNIKILLEENLESYYWIGFILADGHIDGNKRLQITLKSIDYEHLKKLGNYIKCNVKLHNRNNYESCSLSVQDSKYVPLLTEKFDINSNKTKFPPTKDIFEKMDKDKLKSLIIGFIDGDGRISNQANRKDFFLSIKCDKSWFNVLKIFNVEIDDVNRTIINNYGYAKFCVSNTAKLKKLKQFAINNNLPILNRKWNIIDLNYVSRGELYKKRREDIKKLVLEGKSPKEISKMLDINYHTVYGIIKRNKNFKENE